MSYEPIPPDTLLSAYKARELKVECARCRRNAPELQTDMLRRRFGSNVTIDHIVREIAGSGPKPCGLAKSGHCSARASEPPVWMWARLEDAMKGRWMARLYCRRHIAAMKRVDSCPEVTVLDVETLYVAFGYDFPLERLPHRLICPKCHSNVVDIEWIVPPTTPAPHAPAADEPPLRFRPTRAQAGRKRLRVIGED
jgi:hypothetical protein